VLDLALVQRPALKPNLNLGGLAWMAGALFVSLVTVAVNRPDKHSDLVGTDPVLAKKAEEGAERVVAHQAQVNQVEGFDTKFWVGRSLAILCHLVVCTGLFFVCRRHFQDTHAGMAAATFYLLLPYTAAHFGQWHHVWPMALVVWAVVAYRKPTVSGLLLGLAAGTVYFPALIFPAWLNFYRGRGVGRFTGAFLISCGLCLAATGLLLWMDGDLRSSIVSLRSVSAWQPWLEANPGMKGFWTGVPWASAYRLPVFVAYMALVGTMLFWPTPKNLAHVLALSAAAVIGVQFWYADQGGVYVLWYLPLLLLLLFRPNLSAHRPLPIDRDTDWLFRLGRFLVRIAARLVHLPESPVPQR
jgi:glycerol-3-phosphate acyltransferase PlsY